MAASALLFLNGCGGGDGDSQVCEDRYDCSDHGVCSAAHGYICRCDAEYAGEHCEACAEGYQDDDGDGVCEEACRSGDCGPHGTCTTATGSVKCLCDAGYVSFYGEACEPCSTGYTGDGESCDRCAPGYQDDDHDGSCKPDCDSSELSCGPHGTCTTATGTAKCECAPGYYGYNCSWCDDGFQDRDGDGICLPDCETARLNCNGNGACSDIDGTAKCECDTGYAGSSCNRCDTGYQDNDGDGRCKADCQTARLNCNGHGTCSDHGGTAECECDAGYSGSACNSCDMGYQDNDRNGTCLPNCAAAHLSCGDHSACSDISGTAECRCVTGHTGADCSRCANGYQDNDGDGDCRPDCDTARLTGCSGNGTCSAASGVAVCTCEEGYAGTDCGDCADGYQDNDRDGECLPDCETSALSCGDHGVCTDDGGAPVCECEEGYVGDACDECDGKNGYVGGLGDLCIDVCSSYSCSGHGTCDALTGAAMCTCTGDHDGDHCEDCIPGYQDGDHDGTCLPDCDTEGLTGCSGHGTCVTTSGTAECACETGYIGRKCDACDAENGYLRNASGVCEDVCSSFPCGGHGRCDATTGAAACVCETGYSGAHCESCASGYQDDDGDGACAPNCATAGLSGCSGHGTCSTATGTAACACDAGYAGSNCASCSSGYQDDDHDGVCKLDCNNANLSCGKHGTCSTASGTAKCACNTGYTGSTCDSCASGYQDDDGNGTCNPTCSTAGLSGCSGHGTCSTATGTAACSCDQGYSGTKCGYCAIGYQDDDGDGVCKPDCNNVSLSCGRHGKCSTATGTAMCNCDAGYTGGSCSSCASGYQDADGDGVCKPDCSTAGLNCNGHGTCSIATGTAQCNCNQGYGGSSCSSCASGYQDDDHDGVCKPGCGLVSLTCGQHGHCSTYSGTARCECSEGYAGDRCDQCAQGYQDDDHNKTCERDCYSSGKYCGYGYCTTLPYGRPQCVCDEGYSGNDCTSCATNYQDYDNNGTCSPTCTHAVAYFRLDCGHHGDCEDRSGTPLCACDKGYEGELCDKCAYGYWWDEYYEECVWISEYSLWTLIIALNGSDVAPDGGHDPLDEITSSLRGAGDGVSALVLLADSASSQEASHRVWRVTASGRSLIPADRGILWDFQADKTAADAIGNFGAWAVKTFPSEHYALIIRDGASAAGSGAFPGAHRDGVHSPLTGGDYVDALASIAAKAGRKLDLVGIDAGLAGTFENAYALRNHAGYLVASSGAAPAGGWDYARILGALAKDPSMASGALAATIVDACADDLRAGADIAAYDFSNMDALDAELTGFANALAGDGYLSTADLRAVFRRVQRFHSREHADLRHLASLVRESGNAGYGTLAAADRLMAALDETVVRAEMDRSSGRHVDAAGMSVVFPMASIGRGGVRTTHVDELPTSVPMNGAWQSYLEFFLQGRFGLAPDDFR